MVQKPNSIRADLLIIAIILIAGVKFTFGLENALDIGLYDETAYLYRGVTLWNTGLPNGESAPLYAIWYSIISLLEPNSVNLYYLNYKLMTILPPILAYALLRRNTVSIPISLTISWFLLVFRVNAYTWPKVSHFALIVVLATLMLISHKRSLLWSSLLASIGALLVSYVRPEYFLAYLLSSLLFIFVFILEYKKLGRHCLPGLVAYGLFSALLLGALGLPVGGDRSMSAFGQHFSLNWVSWSGSNLNPWTNWQEIISHNFGSVHSIPEALAKNPSVFLKHITYNLRELVKHTPKLVFPVIFPVDKLSRRVAALLIVGLHIAYLSNVRNNLFEYKRLLILVGLFLLPGLVSVVIIYPRDHYLLLLCVLTVAIMPILLTDHAFEQGQMNHKQLLLLGLLVIALTPYFVSQKGVQQPNLSTIRFIQSLGIYEPVNLLEAEGGYNIYLGDNFHRVAEYDKNTDFDNFRTDCNINMIVVSGDLLKDTRFKDDTEWQGFLADYHRFGYLQIEIPNTDRKLIIQADLLHK